MSNPGNRWTMFKQWLVYLALRTFICVVQALPIETCQQVSRVMAYALTHWIRLRSSVIHENLTNTFPHWSHDQSRRATMKMWEHLALMICEIAHAPRKIHDTNWRKYISLVGKRELVAAMTDSRPLVMVSGHFGNFEIGGFVAGLLGLRTYTVARRLDNPYIDRYLAKFRGLNGQYTLDKEGSSKSIEVALKNGATLVLLGDQHAGKAGCWVDFLGRPASCHKAVALFTLTGGALMLVSYSRRVEKPMQFEIGVQGIVDPDTLPLELTGVRPLTQWYNRQLEEMILVDPTQYWWVHRRWRDKPSRAQKVTAISAKAA
jgi:Kdo2-lipid IVA lauroyltransferase/acyltransferase